jgi:hypothetical protein
VFFLKRSTKQQKVVTFYRLVGHLGSSGVTYRYTDGLQ